MRRRSHRALWHLGLAWAVLLGVIIASLLPQGTLERAYISEDAQNIGHFPAYAVLTFALIKAARDSVREPARGVPLALLIASLVAFLTELCQPLVGRMGDVGDLARNVLGILVGFAGWRILQSFKKRPSINDDLE